MKKDNYIKPKTAIDVLNFGYALMQEESLLGTGSAGKLEPHAPISLD